MYKKILVPLDTSELSGIALPYAAEMAAKLGSEVILLHVRTSADAPDKVDHKTYMSQTTADLEERIKSSPNLEKGEKIKVKSELYGFPHRITNQAAEILDYAEKEKVNLIIMATHGRTGLSRWALGSTANKVARASGCPLLLIRAGAVKMAQVNLDNILVTLDGSKPGEAVLPYAENLASRLKSQVTLLHVVEPFYHIYPYAEGVGYYGAAGVVQVPYSDKEMQPTKEVAEKYMKDVNDKLSSKGVRSSYEVRIGSPGEEIIKVEGETHPDMVMMSTHGHSGFGRWEHGSVTDKVLHGGNAPLMLVRAHKNQHSG
jgi:nucleotide-binding universal stress UspA family protein